MKHTLKKILAVILAAATLLCCAPLSGLAEIDLPDISGWLTTLKAKAISDTISISVSPSKIGYSLDSEGNVYINGTKNSTFSFDVNFSTESTETIKFYYVITAPEAFSGADLGYINTGRSVSKSSPFSRTVKLSISKPLALKDSKIEIKAYESGALEDDANLIASASIKVEKFAFSDEDLSEIKKSASVQIKPEVKEVKCNNGLIENNEINFTATIYNNIPPQYNIYEDYIKSSSDFDLELSSVSGRKGDYCDKIKVDSVKNVVIKPGESHTINGTVTLDGSPSDISDTLKEFEAKFGIEIEGTCGGKNVWAYNDRIITIENTQYQSPVNGSHSTVDIKWPTNGINLDGLTSLGLSLSECQDIADIVLVELAMFTLPPKSLETKISEKIINRVFKCNAHLGAVANEMKLVFPVTIDGVDMEIDIICSTTQFSWDGTPYGSFSSIKYKAYTLEGLFNKRKYHSEGTAGMFAAANVKDFFTSAHDFAISEISNATSKCFKTEKGFAEIIFRTIPQLILSKKGKGKALENAGIDLYINAIKLTEIDCPVDVFIYDVAGKLCASVENNEVTLESDDFDLRVNGSTKELYLYGNDYKIVTKATANGTMNVTVEEVGYINGTMHKYEMSDVPLSIGKEYTLEISDEMEDPLNYRLISNNGDVIDNQEVTEDKDSYVPGTSGDSLSWLFNSNTGLLVIRGKGKMPDYNFDSATGSTAPWNKYANNAKTLKIEGALTNIGNYAFCGFANLISVEISNDVTSIGDSSFSGCVKLSSIKIPYYTKSIGKRAFYECENLTDVELPDCLTEIGEYAFYMCIKIENLSFKNELKTIDNYSFYGCQGLTDIMIPDSVTSIGNQAFYECINIKTVDIGDGVTSTNGFLFTSYKNLSEVTIGNGITEIYRGTFEECKNLTKVEIGNSVNRLGSYTFFCCSNLTSITLPDSLTEIGAEAFGGCSGLTNIVIPDNVTFIGFGAFEGCINLKSITIGKSVKWITDYVFWNCGNIKEVHYTGSLADWCMISFEESVSNPNCFANNLFISGELVAGEITIPDKVTQIGDFSFLGCNGITKVVISDNVTKIGKYSFQSCDALESVIIGDGVITIGDYSFSACSNLVDLTIGNKVEYIGKYAFSSCGITSVTIPKSVVTIAAGAFNECESISNLTIVEGGNLNNIGEKAFYNCNSLKKLIIPDGVTDIEFMAFDNCYRLEYVDIGDGITNLNGFHFNSNTHLSDIIIGDGVKEIGLKAFYGCTNLTNVIIGNGVAHIAKQAFAYSGIKNLILGNNVTNIGEQAFVYCKFESISFPDSLIFIGKEAFHSCEKLSEVSLNENSNLETIEYGAFGNCNSLLDVFIPKTVKNVGEKAFYECDSLTQITVDNNNIYYSNDNFGVLFNKDKTILIQYPISNLRKEYIVPKTVIEISDYAFYGSKLLTKVSFLDGIINIGDYCFYNCTNLSNIDLPSSLKNIGEYVFYNCSNLTNVTLGENITGIGRYAFYNCQKLESIVIPKNVTIIEEHTFNNCHNLKHISISDNVTNIGYCAFYECSSITSIVIPNSVTNIDRLAFYRCFKLTDVYYYGTEADWNSIIIGASNGYLTNATIHYNYNPNAHTHSYKLTETIDSTCIDGSKTYVCTECGDSYTEIIPATDKHQKHLAGKWEVVTQPTTESEGKKLIKCERCGTVLLSESIPALSAPSEPIVDADVVKLPTQSTISYGDSILLHVDASKIPEGGRVEWTASNNNFSWSADGDTCKISPKSSGDTTFTATIYDAEGNPVSIDEQRMTSKAGFFDKIIAFFKSLFGLTKTYENVYKGIIR